MARSVLFRDVRVFDGRRLLAADSVLVSGGVIAEVGTGLAAPVGAEVVDGHGQATVLPGLIDAHYHLMGESPLRQSLTFGTTTVLSMGDDPAAVVELKRGAAAGEAHADIRSAGVSAKAPDSRATAAADTVMPTVSGPHDAAAFVAARLAEGSDFLKIRYEDGELLNTVAGRALPVVTKATMAALTAEAHSHGLLVLVHIGTLQAAHDALDAGVDGLAHVFVDRGPDAEIAAKAAECGAFVVPTLNIFEMIAGRSAWRRSLSADPAVEPYLRAEDLAVADFDGEEGHLPVDNAAAAAAVRAFRDVGVPLLAGSDPTTFLHGIGLWRELELLVEAGLPAEEALAAATSVPATLFGLADRGRIAPGLRADLLLVDGNPVADISRLRDLSGVWRAGERIERVRPSRETASTVASGKKAPAPIGSVPGADNSGFLAQTSSGQQGDFALVSVEDGSVVAYRRDNDEWGFPWRRLGVVPVTDGVVPVGVAVAVRGMRWEVVARCVPVSGGAEVLVSVGGSGGMWSESVVVDGVIDGDPAVVSDKDGGWHLLVPSGNSLVHYRRNGGDDAPWSRVAELPAPTPPESVGEVRPVAVSVIAGAFGNLELVVRLRAADGELMQPYYHDAKTGSWASLPVLSDGQKVFGNLGIWEAVVRSS